MDREKIKFSLIIPCYSTPEKYMSRLLDSLTRQGIEKDQLQVIIVDDRSPDKSFIDFAKTYSDRLNIEFHEVKEGKHCPANTRQAGLEYVTGDWLCFCDHDDFYEDNALLQVQDHINEYNSPFAISCNMRSWNEEKDKYVDFIHKLAWLHGKFYNVRHLIKPYNIHFYTDILTHEDVGFNCQVQAVLYELNTDFEYVDLFTYRWVEESTSISRKNTNDRGYLHEYFHEYLKAASEPFMEKAKSGNWWFVNQVYMALLHAYFYYMGAIYHADIDPDHDISEYDDNLETIFKFYKHIVEELEVTPVEIIDFIKSDERKYQIVRNDCIMHEGCFMEYSSFPDFIISIHNHVFSSDSYIEE